MLHLLSLGDRIACHQLSAGRGGQGLSCPRSGQPQGDGGGQARELSDVRLVPLGGDGGQHHQMRADIPDGLGEFSGRGIGTETMHAPAVVVEHDSEHHQPEVVLLAGRAGQDGAGAVAVAPAAGQPGQASAQDIAGEMLAGDAGLAVGPSFAEIVQVRQDHLAQDGFDGEVSQQPIQDRLRGCLVEGIQAGSQRRGFVGQAVAGREGGVGGVGAERGAGGLGSGQALGQAGLHVADPLFVRLGVQPVPPGSTSWLEQPVPVFPRAQELRADPGPTAQFADPEPWQRLGNHGGPPSSFE